MRSAILEKTIFLFLLFTQTSICFGFCKNKDDITLETLEWAERYARQQITRLVIVSNLKSRKRTIEEIEWDYVRLEKLWRKGYASEEDLEAVELSLDEAKLNLRSREQDRELLEGDIQITVRRLEISCGSTETSPEEISKFVSIYTTRWENAFTILVPRIDITKRRIDQANRYLDWVKMMHSRGYRTKTDVRNADLIVFREERRLEIQSGELKIRKDFVRALQEL